MKRIIIYFDKDHHPEETIKEVARLVEEGFISGYYPNWEIEEVKE